MGSTVNYDTCSTRAKGEVIVELAKCDLEKGIKLERIVFDCCSFAPKKEITEELIENLFSMTANGETMNEMMTKILEYSWEDGQNCLMACYSMLVKYEPKRNGSDEAPMQTSTEETIEVLIGLGRDNGFDMARVINHVTKIGQTLFGMSTILSKKVASLLITMNVKVNEINFLFDTVFR